MRRRHSKLALPLALAAVVLGTPERVAAQRGVATDGALSLLLPIGARSVGMGQAVVGSQMGTEAVWWNPAALATLDKVEAAIHHSQSVIGTGDAITFAVPSSLLGVLALSVNILDYGEQSVTDEQQNPIGSILPRDLVYAASYATRIGNRARAGLSYKLVQVRVDCTGFCPENFAFNATTSALDVGMQYDLDGLAPATLGVSVRNFGPRLQVNDSPQSDALPSRIQVGMLYRVPAVGRFARGAELHLSGDVIDAIRVDRPAARFGADLIWEHRVHLRGGYIFDPGEAGGPSVGFGVSVGGLVVDIARLFQGLSADAGQSPTYISLRYLF